MGHRPTVTTDPLNQQQPTIQIQTRVTVGHEDLRTGEDGYLHRTPEVFPTSTHQPHCHQPLGRVQLDPCVGQASPVVAKPLACRIGWRRCVADLSADLPMRPGARRALVEEGPSESDIQGCAHDHDQYEGELCYA